MPLQKWTDLRAYSTGLALALCTRPVMVRISEALQSLSELKSGIPFESYFLWGFTPLLAAGIYIGLSGVKHRALVSVLVGISYPAVMCLIKHFTVMEISLTGNHTDYFIFFSKVLFLSSILTAGTASLAARLRRTPARELPPE